MQIHTNPIHAVAYAKEVFLRGARHLITQNRKAQSGRSPMLILPVNFSVRDPVGFFLSSEALQKYPGLLTGNSNTSLTDRNFELLAALKLSGVNVDDSLVLKVLQALQDEHDSINPPMWKATLPTVYAVLFGESLSQDLLAFIYGTSDVLPNLDVFKHAEAPYAEKGTTPPRTLRGIHDELNELERKAQATDPACIKAYAALGLKVYGYFVSCNSCTVDVANIRVSAIQAELTAVADITGRRLIQGK